MFLEGHVEYQGSGSLTTLAYFKIPYLFRNGFAKGDERMVYQNPQNKPFHLFPPSALLSASAFPLLHQAVSAPLTVSQVLSLTPSGYFWFAPSPLPDLFSCKEHDF